MSPVHDVARIRLDNALRLFDEFVRATVKQADAATLRGLERRFAERLQIQPSYWSQIKSRSRQIGERLARQFEQLNKKPVGWMDQPHGGLSAAASLPAPRAEPHGGGPDEASPLQPQDDDERFIVGLVLTYYRRHPQRARTRLLDLLGEVLAPPPPADSPANPSRGTPASGTGTSPRGRTGAAPAPVDDRALWLRSQTGVAPLKRKP
jgi:hypothetical protein